MATIRIGQAALQFSDRRPDTREDVRHFLRKLAPDIGSFTEAGDLIGLLEDEAQAAGYRLVAPYTNRGTRATTPIVVRRETCRLTSAGWIDVLPPDPRKPAEGGHGPRGLVTASVNWGNEGSLEDVSLIAWHAITGYGSGDPVRDRQILDQFRVAAATTRRLARGSDLAFSNADENYDVDDPSNYTPAKIMREHGLFSAWDLAGKPDVGTHGDRTIDVTRVYRGDVRVSVVGARTFPVNSDHDQTIVSVAVRPRVRA